MSETVYVVTQGQYSDYLIEGVFSNRDLADEYVKQAHLEGLGERSIEEWTLDELAGKTYRQWFWVTMDMDGTILEENGTQFWLGSQRESKVHMNLSGTTIYAKSTVSMEHARKVAAEKRQSELRSRAIITAKPETEFQMRERVLGEKGE